MNKYSFGLKLMHTTKNNNNPGIKNNFLYDCFQFRNEYHTHCFGNYSKIDSDRLKIYFKINDYYNLKKNKHFCQDTKILVDNYYNVITKIYFGYEFNKPVDNLPNTIYWLLLGKSFNKFIIKYPSGLRYLTFGYDFNQPVCNLPDSLERIVFGGRFNNPIDNLPDSITHLSFYFSFYVSNDYYKFGLNKNVEHFPSGMTLPESDFDKIITKLPKKLTHLVLEKNKNFYGLDSVIKNTNITHIQFDVVTYDFLINLPDSLEHLSTKHNSYNSLEMNKINKSSEQIFPDNLKFLEIEIDKINYKFLSNLPSGLDTLIIKVTNVVNVDNENILSNLPSNLRYLKIIIKFNITKTNISLNDILNFDYLPNSITHLTIETDTTKSQINIKLDNLPNSITHLWINSYIVTLFYPQNNIKELYCSKNYINTHKNSLNQNIILKYFD